MGSLSRVIFDAEGNKTESGAYLGEAVHGGLGGIVMIFAVVAGTDLDRAVEIIMSDKNTWVETTTRDYFEYSTTKDIQDIAVSGLM